MTPNKSRGDALRSGLVILLTSGSAACLENPELEQSAASAVSGDCSGTRYIAYHTTSSPCAQLDDGRLGSSWSGRQLFEAMPWENRAPGSLGGFCIFEWAPGPQQRPYPGSRALLAELTVGLPDATALHRDCPNLQPQGTDFVSQHWQEMLEDFRGQAGAVDGVGGANITTRATVTVIDDWQDELASDWTETAAYEPGAARSHGYALARVIEDLTCDGGFPTGPCLVQTRSVRALNAAPEPKFKKTPQPVGAHGYLSDLAAAIYRATRLDDTKQASALPAPQVLNLSLGWAPIPQLGGSIGELAHGEKAAAAAVFEALKYAGCRDALVFAAAGNNHTGEAGIDDAPLYPAAWTQRSTLSASQCSAEYGVLGGQGVRPLAQAVGSQVADGSPAASSRRDATPALGALGVAALAEIPHTGAATRPMSGSSVSTAIVSATAAALWSLEPTWSASDVLDVLYANAAPLAVSAVLHDGIRTAQHQVRPCAAIEAYCSTTGNCSMTCAPAAGVVFDPGELMVPPTPGLPAACSLSSSPVANGNAPCSAGAPALDLRPHTVPQPGDTYCPVCNVEVGLNYADFILQIHSLDRVTPKFAALSDGTATYGYDFDDFFPSSLAPEQTHNLKLGSFSVPPGIEMTSGVIYFEVENVDTGIRSSVSTELGIY